MTVPEAMLQLSKAIDRRALEIHAGEGDPSQDRADSKDLVRACARLIAGQMIYAAFGSPGDWGYSTPIGKALNELYRVGGGIEAIR